VAPRPVRWRLIGLPVLVALAHWWWIHPESWPLTSGDAYHYALLARRLAGGEGFTIGSIFPVELDHGVSRDHPSLLRAPLWPLTLAAGFRLFGPETTVVHGTLLVFYLGTVGAATALAMTLGGSGLGLLAGLAIATCPSLAIYAVDGLSEVSFAFWVTLAFLLLAREASAVAIGAVCGLAYLTRYNGVVLLAAAVPLLVARRSPLRALLALAGAFGLVALPWWVRNFLVVGDPFYSLYRWVPFMDPWVGAVGLRPPADLSLWLQLDPASARNGVEPLGKAIELLPKFIAQFPLAAANLAALLGVLGACARRERLALGFLVLVAGTTFVIAFTFFVGRFLQPLVPVMIALGAAAWGRAPRPLGIAGLAGLLLAPLLPAFPREIPDVRLWRAVVYDRAGATPWSAPTAEADPGRCLTRHSLVVSSEASRLAWETDAIVVELPASVRDFRRILERYPVEFVHLPSPSPGLQRLLEANFVRRGDCGPHIYARRPAPT
jgi:4-amino-4-deoxy-L-arabinose transferase-like glycosyltransferase